MKEFLFFIFLALFLLFPITCNLFTVSAIVDPLSVPNNKFGIHIIQATPDESSPAASLVNSSGGDWGYITVLIQSNDRNQGKWQEFFNDLRRRHLIPLVRIATIPQGNLWIRPNEGEEIAWANFLNSLKWPTKNRYVIIYNEPNHATEWGGSVDAKSYAITLDKTISALKNKSQDFFVLNAGLDASAPAQLPNYEEEVSFLKNMDKAVPGIFEKLDGWVSHSYPNPGFTGSPNGFGRGTVRTWYWEIQQLRNLGVSKDLPIFITETGWKHAEGMIYDFSLPDAKTVSKYFEEAFDNAWNNSNIVAITPFLLSYQESLFDHFSFKKLDADEKDTYYPQFQTILNMPKTLGKPIQENKAELIRGEIYKSMVAEQTYEINLTFKNTGQSIWDPSTSSGQVRLVPIEGGRELGISEIAIPMGIKIEPDNEYTFDLILKAPQKGKFIVKLNLFNGEKQFDTNPLSFTTEVKLPVILQVLNSLKWKNSPAGEYVLRVSGVVGDSTQKVILGPDGKSEELEVRYLLPDYPFDFTLEKPYYHPITIHQTVKPGVNTLDFGILQPNLLQAILHPKQLWQLLPFSN